MIYLMIIYFPTTVYDYDQLPEWKKQVLTIVKVWFLVVFSYNVVYSP